MAANSRTRKNPICCCSYLCSSGYLRSYETQRFAIGFVFYLAVSCLSTPLVAAQTQAELEPGQRLSPKSTDDSKEK